jgi:hypothetical protein
MDIQFYGRKHELSVLREDNWRNKSMLSAIYGRRRVGKTALVEFAYKNDLLWKFDGIENAKTATQIQFFLKQLAHYSCPDVDLFASDWDEAFTLLNNQMLSIEKNFSKKLVIFFDEFQWMCEMKGKLVSIFKYHWDNYLSKHPKCIFILCGSVSSFIVKKVIQSNSLYGRIDLEINLQPLSLTESHSFFKNTISEKNFIETYMVFGGIPQYLLELNPRMSLMQNLNEYAFKPTGFFFNEFNRLFISHFASNTIYEKILKNLSKGKLYISELAKKCNVSSGGNFTERLHDTELAGFISKQIPVDKEDDSRLIKFCINDEFLHFYFRFIAPNSSKIVNGHFSFNRLLKIRDYNQWQGLAFERLCQKHSKQIAEYQRFSAVDYKAGSWFKRANYLRGAQVDLVFVRADKILTACEIKYSSNLKPASIINAFEQKCKALQQSFPMYAIEKVLILGKTGTKNLNLKSYFDHILMANELFDCYNAHGDENFGSF